LRKAAFLAIAFCTSLQAEVKLPALIADHMLIQQDAPVRIWGKAAAGETVIVTFQSQKLSATAAPSGYWQVFLDPIAAGGPFEMTIAGSNTITIQDILAGEVWVGSGQSNMEFPMSKVADAEKEIAAANFQQIRLFTVKRIVAEQPADDVQGSWSACTPESVRNFSAVEYFFGRELHLLRRIPMGLIHSSWGGTPAQSWTEKSFLKDDPLLQPYLTAWDKVLTDFPAKKEAYEKNTLPKWEEQVAAAKAAGKQPPNKPGVPPGPGHQNTPSGLYNGMIAPLVPYTIRGAIWYQGESNANSPADAQLYRRLFTSMIESWRSAWGQGSFPFYYVQLANYRTNGNWPLLRESQTATLELANTAQALAIDVGNPTDIHPNNKQTVGHRLALAAREHTYGERIVSSGPMFRQMTTSGATARVWYDAAGGGLEPHVGPLTGFAIAGEDQKFYPAAAKIVGTTVVLSSPEVADPKAVRYAWADDPAANLYNREGLPAVPFRTDNWTATVASLKVLSAPAPAAAPKVAAK
jgi:sialate O-acetylesterase